MDCLSRGYYTVVLSPILSVATWAFMIFLDYVGWVADLTTELMVIVGIQISLISIQACGLIGFFGGYRKKELFSSNLHVNFLLILWGFSAVLLSWAWNLYMLMSTSPPMKPFFWLNMVYTIWTLKGLIWIASG